MKIKHYNEEKDRVVVFFCGYMFGDWVFADLFSSMGEFHIIAVEAAGSSRAGVQGGSHFEAVGWLYSYLSEMNIDRYFVAGHSMGGFVAQLYSDTYPQCVQGMALLGTCAPSQFTLSHRSHSSSAVMALFDLDQESLFKFATYNIFTSKILSEESSLNTLRRRFTSDLPVKEACEEQIVAIGETIKWSSDKAPTFSCPALVLMGGADIIIPPEWSMALKDSLVGDSEFYVIDSSHMFMYETPAVTAQHLIDWLDRHS